MDGFAEFKVEISPSVILCFLKTFRSVENVPGLNNGLSKSEIVNPDVNHHGVTLSEDKDVLRCVLADYMPCVKEFSLVIGSFDTNQLFDGGSIRDDRLPGIPTKLVIQNKKVEPMFNTDWIESNPVQFVRFLVAIGNRKLFSVIDRIYFLQKYVYYMSVKDNSYYSKKDNAWFEKTQSELLGEAIYKRFMAVGDDGMAVIDDLVLFILEFRLLGDDENWDVHTHFGVIDGIHRLTLMDQLLYDDEYNKEFFQRFQCKDGYKNSFLHCTSNVCLWVPPDCNITKSDNESMDSYKMYSERLIKISKNKLCESVQIARHSCVDFFRACLNDVTPQRVHNNTNYELCYRVHQTVHTMKDYIDGMALNSATFDDDVKLLEKWKITVKDDKNPLPDKCHFNEIGKVELLVKFHQNVFGMNKMHFNTLFKVLSSNSTNDSILDYIVPLTGPTKISKKGDKKTANTYEGVKHLSMSGGSVPIVLFVVTMCHNVVSHAMLLNYLNKMAYTDTVSGVEAKEGTRSVELLTPGMF